LGRHFRHLAGRDANDGIVAVGGFTDSVVEVRGDRDFGIAPGPYSFEIRVPAHTQIAAHTHRDNRTALVVSGEWHFGYGQTASEAASKRLVPGSFYTEPASVAHFAFTGDAPTVVYIAGVGPTDTLYVNAIDDPTRQSSKQ
jgi:quercetin dioxygenase-like cupin family protein